MGVPSIIFFTAFVLPLLAFMIWIVVQDKHKAVTGLVVLFVIFGGLAWVSGISNMTNLTDLIWRIPSVIIVGVIVWLILNKRKKTPEV